MSAEVLTLADRRATSLRGPAAAAATTDDRILRMPAVRQRTGLSAATIYRRIAAGDFPRAVSLGGTSVGWRNSDINGWIASRAGSSACQR